MVRENLNPAVKVEGILPTMFDGRTLHSREAIEILEENFGELVYKTRIRKTVRYAEAPVKGAVRASSTTRRPGRRGVPRTGEGGARWREIARACVRARWPSCSAPPRPPSGRPSRPRRPSRSDSRRSHEPVPAAEETKPKPRSKKAKAPEAAPVGPPEEPQELTVEHVPDFVAEAHRGSGPSRRPLSSASPCRRRSRRRGLRRRPTPRARAPVRAAGEPLRAVPEPAHGSSRAAPRLGSYLAVIRVVGVGGAGLNAVNRMIDAGISQVEFVAVNTDMQQLQLSDAPVKIHIGRELTQGLGSGADPDDRDAAPPRSTYDQIKNALRGSDMVFVTAGEGGGTGTGAAPVVREVARELGALTVGIVTTPFRFEGTRRKSACRRGRRGAPRGVRHRDRDPERPLARGARPLDVDDRRVQDRRRRPPPGRAGHLRPDHDARPDQPRLRRRAHDHGRRRVGADGHRLRHRRGSGPRRPPSAHCARR